MLKKVLTATCFGFALLLLPQESGARPGLQVFEYPYQIQVSETENNRESAEKKKTDNSEISGMGTRNGETGVRIPLMRKYSPETIIRNFKFVVNALQESSAYGGWYRNWLLAEKTDWKMGKNTAEYRIVFILPNVDSNDKCSELQFVLPEAPKQNYSRQYDYLILVGCESVVLENERHIETFARALQTHLMSMRP